MKNIINSYKKDRQKRYLIFLWLALFMTVTVAMNFQIKLYKTLAHNFCADLYIFPADDSKEQQIAPESWAEIALDDRVIDLEAVQKKAIILNGKKARVIGAPFQKSLHRYTWITPPESDFINDTDFAELEPIYVTEGLARDLKMNNGSVLSIPIADDERSAIVAGVLKAKGIKTRSIIIERSTFSHWFNDYRAIYLAALLATQEKNVISALSSRYPGLRFYSQKEFLNKLLRPTYFLFGMTYLTQIIAALFLLKFSLRPKRF